MRLAAVLAIASIGLAGCDSLFPWTPSEAQNAAAQGESCNSVAMRQQIDAGYSGFDQKTQQDVLKEALMECSSWRNRVPGPPENTASIRPSIAGVTVQQ